MSKIYQQLRRQPVKRKKVYGEKLGLFQTKKNDSKKTIISNDIRVIQKGNRKGIHQKPIVNHSAFKGVNRHFNQVSSKRFKSYLRRIKKYGNNKQKDNWSKKLKKIKKLSPKKILTKYNRENSKRKGGSIREKSLLMTGLKYTIKERVEKKSKKWEFSKFYKIADEIEKKSANNYIYKLAYPHFLKEINKRKKLKNWEQQKGSLKNNLFKKDKKDKLGFPSPSLNIPEIGKQLSGKHIDENNSAPNWLETDIQSIPSNTKLTDVKSNFSRIYNFMKETKKKRKKFNGGDADFNTIIYTKKMSLQTDLNNHNKSRRLNNAAHYQTTNDYKFITVKLNNKKEEAEGEIFIGVGKPMVGISKKKWDHLEGMTPKGKKYKIW